MRRRTIFVTLASLIVITFSACENKTEVNNTPESEESFSEINNEEKNTEDLAETTTQPSQPESEDATPAVNDNDAADISVTLDTPPFEYYLSDKAKIKENLPIKLNLISEEPNEITDDDKWFSNNELTDHTFEASNIFRNIDENLPEGIADMCGDLIITSAFYDDSYIYCVYGSNFGEGYMLNIYDADSLEMVHTLDFSNYCCAPEYINEDYDFIKQKINWAAIKDNILYIAHSHNT